MTIKSDLYALGKTAMKLGLVGVDGILQGMTEQNPVVRLTPLRAQQMLLEREQFLKEEVCQLIPIRRTIITSIIAAKQAATERL